MTAPAAAPMPEPIVIVGAGGHGRETLDVVRAINVAAHRWDFVGFVADQADAEVLSRTGAPWLGTVEEVAQLRRVMAYVIGIGHGPTRRRIDAQLAVAGPGWTPATLVHPTATIGADVRLGPGVVIAAGARVTTNVTLGRHTQLNVNAVVSHDCVVGHYVTLSPGVLVNGTNTIGDAAFLGTGAVVTPGHDIGAGAIVGAGAVVVADVAAGTTVKGAPAR